MNRKKPARQNSKIPRSSTFEEFDALSDEEKEEVYRSVDREFKPSEMRPLSGKQRKEYEAIQRRMGRPKIGKGAHVVGISLERDLLKRAEAFAKQNHMKRSELVAASLSLVIENPKLLKRAGAA